MYVRAKRQVLILGGGYAGLVAAARAARAVDGVAVTLVNGDAHFVQRIRMHELLAGRRPRTLPIAPLLRKRGVRFVEGYVDILEPARQRVVGHYKCGGVFEHGYDELVVALGSRTGAPVPGAAEHTLRLNDRVAVQAA